MKEIELNIPKEFAHEVEFNENAIQANLLIDSLGMRKSLSAIIEHEKAPSIHVFRIDEVNGFYYIISAYFERTRKLDDAEYIVVRVPMANLKVHAKWMRQYIEAVGGNVQDIRKVCDSNTPKPHNN